MNLLVGALIVGALLSLLALGVFITYRVLGSLDLTADGAFSLGGAAAAVLLAHGIHPVPATVVGAFCGMVAGTITGVTHTRFRISVVLAGILTTTALYSVNLYLMRGGNLSLVSQETLVSIAERLGPDAIGGRQSLAMLGVSLSTARLTVLVAVLALAAGAAMLLSLFFHTNVGLGVRATGNNPDMARALGIDVRGTVILSLALANGMIGLSGAVFAQYQGFANVEMGVGMLVTGLASIMVGEALVRGRSMGRRITGALLGAVVFRLLVAGAIRVGLDANALKLVTAAFVLAALVLPDLAGHGLRTVSRRAGRAPARA